MPHTIPTTQSNLEEFVGRSGLLRLLPPNSVIELTDESAYHQLVSLFSGKHITAR